MRELAHHHQEDDQARNPRHHFIPVHRLVSEQCDDEGPRGDDDNAGITGHILIDGMQQLRPDYHIHG